MTLSSQRTFTTPHPGEDWADIAARVFPDIDSKAAIEQLQSWNLHLFLRQPRGRILGADVVFTQPPQGQPQ